MCRRFKMIQVRTLIKHEGSKQDSVQTSHVASEILLASACEAVAAAGSPGGGSGGGGKGGSGLPEIRAQYATYVEVAAAKDSIAFSTLQPQKP